MHSTLLALPFIFISGLAVASPWNDGIKCVQNQLNAAGYDVGPADGVIGSRTRGALSDFGGSFGVSTDEPIVPENAAAYCRKLGLASTKLQAFWPSNDLDVEVVANNSIDSSIATVIRSSSKSGHALAAEKMGVELAGTDVVVVGDTAASINNLVLQHASIRLRDKGKHYANRCKKDYFAVNASTKSGVTVFCASVGASLQNVGISGISWLAAHEATHLVQFQIAGGVDISPTQKAYLSALGPLWLLEGTAETIASIHARQSSEEFRLHLSQNLGDDIPDLRTVELAGRVRGQALYSVSALAVTELVGYDDLSKVGVFYNQLGNGIEWETAFTTAFGVSPEEFYVDFDERWRQ